MSAFSVRLKQLRAQKEENQKTIADYLGVSLQSYSTYENGREPNYDSLIKLANYFDVTTDYLVGNSEYKRAETTNIGAVTGLSEKAIQILTIDNIKAPENMYSQFISSLLTDNAFDSFFESFYIYLNRDFKNVIEGIKLLDGNMPITLRSIYAITNKDETVASILEAANLWGEVQVRFKEIADNMKKKLWDTPSLSLLDIVETDDGIPED